MFSLLFGLRPIGPTKMTPEMCSANEQGEEHLAIVLWNHTSTLQVPGKGFRYPLYFHDKTNFPFFPWWMKPLEKSGEEEPM
jgi:hypothetical protein